MSGSLPAAAGELHLRPRFIGCPIATPPADTRRVLRLRASQLRLSASSGRHASVKCLHVLSSFQRTRLAARPAPWHEIEPRSPSTSSPWGEPSNITIGVPSLSTPGLDLHQRTRHRSRQVRAQRRLGSLRAEGGYGSIRCRRVTLGILEYTRRPWACQSLQGGFCRFASVRSR